MLSNFIRYHWDISTPKKEFEREDKSWTNKVVPIVLASGHPSKEKFFDKKSSILKKAARLIPNCLLTIYNSLTITPANKLAWYDYLLRSQQDKAIYKGIIYCQENFQPTFLITDPNIITAILMHERNEVGEGAMFSGGVPVQVAKKILGNNILTCPETEHKPLLNFSSPHFTSQNTIPFFPNFLEMSKELIEEWLVKEKSVISINHDLSMLAAGAVARNLLGYQGSVKKLCKAMHTLLEIHQKKFRFSQDRKKYNEALDFIKSSAEETHKRGQNSFLKCMKEAKNKDGKPRFQAEEVLSMAKILFFGGQDSTSSLLTFLLYTLGQDSFKEWQDRLLKEFEESNGGMEKFVLESKSLDNLLKEGLRYHPSAFTQTRETVQDLIVDDRIFIPKGSLLYLLHYFSQRDSRRWGEESLSFKPNRFEDPKLTAKIHGPLQYFSLGPSICLGRHFAGLLVKTFIMQMIRTARWESRPPTPSLEANIMIELKPSVNIRIEKREYRC